MVIRNENGKVQFNVAVSEGMTFKIKIVHSKKGNKGAFVRFLVCEDPDKGLESFMILTKAESMDKCIVLWRGWLINEKCRIWFC